MKNPRFPRTVLLAVIAVLLFASNVLATGISGILVLENKSKGRHYSIVVKPDGSFQTPELPKGSYEFRFEAKSGKTGSMQKGVTTIPPQAAIDASDVQISYSSQPEIVSNEKRAGKAKYKNIVLKRGLVSDNSRWGDISFTSSSIAIDEPGVQIAGTITIKNPSGKPMAVDDWTVTK